MCFFMQLAYISHEKMDVSETEDVYKDLVSVLSNLLSVSFSYL